MNIDVPIDVLAFDIGGSVFDWKSSVVNHVRFLTGDRASIVNVEQFAMDWRGRMFELLRPVRAYQEPWVNAEILHRRALDDIAEAYPSLGLSDTDREILNRCWHQMPVWHDFPPALERLRKSYPCVVLTLLSYAIAMNSSRHNQLVWDGILSCEFLGYYKPDPRAYRAACRILNTEPHRVLMVASHPSDLRGAQAAGMQTAFVAPHLVEPSQAGDDSERGSDTFNISVARFEELADRLCAR